MLYFRNFRLSRAKRIEKPLVKTRQMISLVKRDNRAAQAARILRHIFAVLWTTMTVKSQKEDNTESFILSFQSETPRTDLFLGYFAHIEGRERDGTIAKDLR